MKEGNIYLAELRTHRFLFDFLFIEIEYLENFYTMLGNIVAYQRN